MKILVLTDEETKTVMTALRLMQLNGDAVAGKLFYKVNGKKSK